MNEFIIQTSLVGVLVVVTGVLAFMLFYKKSLVHSHIIQILSVVMALVAVLVSVYDKVISPLAPEAFAECIVSGEFAPVSIQCKNSSEEYSSIRWVYDDGTIIKDVDTVERVVDAPGSYKIILEAEPKGIFRGEASRFETTFQVMEKPIPAKVIETEKRFDAQGKGGSFQRTFEADPGYKILSATLKTFSKKNVLELSVSHNENQATVRGQFIVTPHLKGLQIKIEGGYVAGAIVLKQQEIRPKKSNNGLQRTPALPRRRP
ncbi:hypothetical protein BT049_RS03375 [Vibrio parahaemolyticus]|nr:hypothetical protein [Vibrio parahaemolyticus]ELA7161071.1 hypothetical protein [Vibrio parahaemolyticus]MDG2998408.1 hypothetical protein [Vibrio parahaemolyticus]MDG3036295.1 hypothetical protein [Vibrio parahaemolyticus]